MSPHEGRIRQLLHGTNITIQALVEFKHFVVAAAGLGLSGTAVVAFVGENQKALGVGLALITMALGPSIGGYFADKRTKTRTNAIEKVFEDLQEAHDNAFVRVQAAYDSVIGSRGFYSEELKRQVEKTISTFDELICVSAVNICALRKPKCGRLTSKIETVSISLSDRNVYIKPRVRNVTDAQLLKVDEKDANDPVALDDDLFLRRILNPRAKDDFVMIANVPAELVRSGRSEEFKRPVQSEDSSTMSIMIFPILGDLNVVQVSPEPQPAMYRYKGSDVMGSITVESTAKGTFNRDHAIDCEYFVRTMKRLAAYAFSLHRLATQIEKAIRTFQVAKQEKVGPETPGMSA